MDVQYAGSVLLALYNIQCERPRPTTPDAVDAFYERHAAGHRFVPRLVSFVITTGVGFMIMSHWLG